MNQINRGLAWWVHDVGAHESFELRVWHSVSETDQVRGWDPGASTLIKAHCNTHHSTNLSVAAYYSTHHSTHASQHTAALVTYT